MWYIIVKNAANPRDHYITDKWSASHNNYTGSPGFCRVLQSLPPPLWRQHHYSRSGQFMWQCYKCSETHCLKFATLAPPSHSLIYAKNILNEWDTKWSSWQLTADSVQNLLKYIANSLKNHWWSIAESDDSSCHDYPSILLSKNKSIKTWTNSGHDTSDCCYVQN